MIERGDAESGATFSDCWRYRYNLWRHWSREDGYLVWILLNPSTADERKDDPTVRRCMAFARRWAFGGVEIVNVYALRSTDPRNLWRAADPVGPENDERIRDAIRGGGLIVAAWGAHAKRERVEEIRKLHDAVRGRTASIPPLQCLGVSKSGAPRHPLYVPGSTPVVDWRPPA